MSYSLSDWRPITLLLNPTHASDKGEAAWPPPASAPGNEVTARAAHATDRHRQGRLITNCSTPERLLPATSPCRRSRTASRVPAGEKPVHTRSSANGRRNSHGTSVWAGHLRLLGECAEPCAAEIGHRRQIEPQTNTSGDVINDG